jgi:hypothetical protein
MNEKELRTMLQRKADAFVPRRRPAAELTRKARVRAARSIIAGFAVVVIAIPLAQLAQGRLSPPDETAYAALVVEKRALAKRAEPAEHHPDKTREHPHKTRGETITREDLENHANCMRRYGVDLPAPTKTGDGWTILMDRDPEERWPRWREAVFVHCRLLDASDDLVLGGRSKAEVTELIACVRAEGLRLPEPQSSSAGFVFDLDAVDPPWGTKRWYQAIFVTCAG